jgi:iron complex outermembrane recepter protein
MYRISKIATIVLCLFPYLVFSQYIIRGKVMYEKTKKPISNVSVSQFSISTIDSTVETHTDINGQFRLVTIDTTSLVQFLSFQHEDVRIKPTKDSVFVYLRERKIEYYQIESSPYLGSLPHKSFVLTSSQIKKGSDVHVAKALSRNVGLNSISTGNSYKPMMRGLYGSRICTEVAGVRLDNYQWIKNQGIGINDIGLERLEVTLGAFQTPNSNGGAIIVVNEHHGRQCGCFGDCMPDQIQNFNLKISSNTGGFGLDYGFKKEYNYANKLSFKAGFETHADFEDAQDNRVSNSRFANYDFNGGYLFSLGQFKSDNYIVISKNIYGVVTDSSNKSDENDRFTRQFEKANQSNFLVILSSRNTIQFENDFKLNLDLGLMHNNFSNQDSTKKPLLDMKISNYSLNTYLVKSFKGFWFFTNGISVLNQKHANKNENIEIPNAKTTEISAYSYLQKAFSVFKSTLYTEGGIRYTKTNISLLETPNFKPFKSEDLPFENSYNVVNGSFGFAYQLRRFNLKTSIVRGFRTPNLSELSSNSLNDHWKIWEVGNTDLKLEQNTSMDFTFKTYLTKRHEFYLQGSVFQNKFDNFIFLKKMNTSIKGFPTYQYDQTGATFKGFETEIGYKNQWFSNDVEFSLNYSYLNVSQNTGDLLPLTPPNKWNAHAQIFGNDGFRWSLNLNATFVEKQNNPSEFETTTPQYFLLSAGAGVYVKNKRFLLTCTNLTNTFFTDYLSQIRNLGHRDMGRNFVFNFGLQF